jgi:hypothetical protein
MVGGIKGESNFFKCNNGGERKGKKLLSQGRRKVFIVGEEEITVGEKTG